MAGAVGRLFEDEQFRARHQSAGYGQLLLLAAGEIAATTAQHRLEHGKQLEQLCRNVPVGGPERRKAGFQVFLYRQKRENPATLRHMGDARPGRSSGRLPSYCI